MHPKSRIGAHEKIALVSLTARNRLIAFIDSRPRRNTRKKSGLDSFCIRTCVIDAHVLANYRRFAPPPTSSHPNHSSIPAPVLLESCITAKFGRTWRAMRMAASTSKST